MIVEKKIIRKSILDKRMLLRKEEVEENSKRIIEGIYKTKEFSKSLSVMCYIDFKNEVRTEDFIKLCLDEGKKVSVPYIKKNSSSLKIMIASEISAFDNDMERNLFGILEPKKQNLKEVDPSEIDLVIVPGVAFDIYKNRLGYGAGFYDRFLEYTGKDCFKLGIAHDLQIIEELPAKEYDKRMDCIITEKRIIL